jgi:hypothetical protein
MEGNGWGLIWVTPGIFPEELWKTMKKLHQDRGSIRAIPSWKSKSWVSFLGECAVYWALRVWGPFIMCASKKMRMYTVPFWSFERCTNGEVGLSFMKGNFIMLKRNRNAGCYVFQHHWSQVSTYVTKCHCSVISSTPVSYVLFSSLVL